MKETLLTAIILTKNAEDILKDCLDSLSFCNEIIVVDNGSADKTKQIAKSAGAVVIDGIDNNFAENRNKGLKKASGKWILYIDSDERVTDKLKESIRKAITLEDFSAYKLQRKNFYLGNNPWPKIEHLERLFKKDHIKEWYGKLHETPRFEGKIGELNGYLFHFTHRDLESMLSKTIAWSKIEAQLRYDTHHPKIVIWRLVRVMVTGFWDSYIKQGGWKAGTMGFVESMYQSYSMFVTYAALWEMQHNEK